MGLSNIIDHPFSWFAARSAGFFENHLPWLLPGATAKPAMDRKPGSFALAMLAGSGQDALLVAEWIRAEDMLTEKEGKGSRTESA